MATMSGDVFNALKDVLGLPKNTIAFKLAARVGEAVVIECEYRPEINMADLAAALKPAEKILPHIPMPTPFRGGGGSKV